MKFIYGNIAIIDLQFIKLHQYLLKNFQKTTKMFH
jgi:hypothetical protein